MKFLKWLMIGLVALVLLAGVGIAALVYLVDWNNYKDEIQNAVRKQTGRELVIAGDLEPTFFPWAGISTGAIQFANAEGFGDQPFAAIESAGVKVKLLPLLRRQINVSEIQLDGLQLDLQRAADGSTNWDDLINDTAAATTTTNEGEVEVEGNSATIAALAVGGIQISNANVSWNDAQAGTDVKLADFNLGTGSIELARPFDLTFDADISSTSMAMSAELAGKGEVMVDLEGQTYSLRGFTLDTVARGESFPGGTLEASVAANINALLGDQRIDVTDLVLDTLGMELGGNLNVTGLDAEPLVAGSLTSNEFSPKELFAKLGVPAPETASDDALTKASLAMDIKASPASAALDNIVVKLDDSTIEGGVSLPSLAGAMPPVRFDFNLDTFNVDNYLPPAAEADATDADATASGGAEGGDTPIELPTELLRNLDVDGTFRVGEFTAKNLKTTDIVIPVKAGGGKLGIENMTAQLYQGAISSSAGVDVSGSGAPRYAMNLSLDGIQAEPLLADFMQKDAPLSGGGKVTSSVTTSGNSVNALKSGLNGSFSTAFTDGSINGINIGYQLRRASAALSGKSMAAQAKEQKTDFSSLSMSGQIRNGVIASNDLDMRSPLLRLAGDGQVSLPAENVDYTTTVLVTGTTEGQGGKDLEALKGVKVALPIKATFKELSENAAGVMIRGLRQSLTSNLENQAKALAEQRAKELKEAARAKADEAVEGQKEQLRGKANEAIDNLDGETTEALDEALGGDAKEKLKGLFGN
ncbi:MAG: hypothetical protein CSB44_00925 [Gammaproteobacteria bacterium]|nr:MAG: hypothetical protein CSB44_00925 [Gammaproteobacteria bacterium]